MYKVLVVDDERIEREGIKYLLSEEGQQEIFEASNGRDALKILQQEKIDLLITDIKMPYMDGLELAGQARELDEKLQIIIFSGYGDFAFAQEAIRYGVTEYVLKPVDPEKFHEVIQKVEKEIFRLQNHKEQEEKGREFLQQYFLQNYIYSGNQELLEKAGDYIDREKWGKWCVAILIETERAFFDSEEETVEEEIKNELRREFSYLNLNNRQSLLLFHEKQCDYVLVAKHIYFILKRRYSDRFHLAVSKIFDGYLFLPETLNRLEILMEEKFFRPEKHVFTYEDKIDRTDAKEIMDSHIMEKISEDISRNDMEQLWYHFRCLKEKYWDNRQFSAMYVKFVFSNLIQELFQEKKFSSERSLEKEIDRLYSCSNIMDIIRVTEENIREYEAFVERTMSESRGEVATIKKYIYQNYKEDLNLEKLAEKVYLSSGYLSFIFKKETGMNLNRFVRIVRMEKAKELLCDTNMKVAQISEEVGYTNTSYFCRSFREYFGTTPELYRKDTGDE